MIPTRARAAALALVAAVGFAACREPVSEGPRTNTVRAVMAADPTSLSLLGNTDNNSQIIAHLVTDSLVDYDRGLGFRPKLATSWEVSPDGLVVTFHLRPGVRWHDGSPVTARDVGFTWRKAREPATQARGWSGQLESVAAVETPDDRTVVVRYRVPHADFLDAWRVPILPERLASADPDFLTGEYAKHPVGCGPFRFVRWVPGSEIVLEANPDYWDGPPLVSGIRFKLLGDERTGFEALRRGEIDVMAVTPDTWREATSSTSEGRLGRFVYYRLAAWMIDWNQDGSNPFFTDSGTRRAMVLALDRERFGRTILHGLARPAAGTWLPESGWADPGLRPWPFAPEEACRLLDRAGWRLSARGAIREKDGVPFSFTLMVPGGTQDITDRIASWIQQSLADVGVRMEIEKLEWRTFQQRRREHRFQAAMASRSFTPVPDQFELYHSSQRATGFNYAGLADPEIDEAVELGRKTLDPARRREIYARLQRRVHELEPVSCLFQFAQPVLHDLRLQGIVPSALGLYLADPGPREWRWSDGSTAR